MSELIKLGGDYGLIDILHNDGTIELTQLFSRETLLWETRIAGTAHLPYIQEVEPQLQLEEELLLRREPENLYDPWAILILRQDQTKLGYVPRGENLILARLLDAGKNLLARLKAKEWQRRWLRLDIAIYLQDT